MKVTATLPWRVVCVDFDGTLVEDAYPEIGPEKSNIVEFVKWLSSEGVKIILHTCRVNGTKRKYLDEAVQWCAEHDIPLYDVNHNPTDDDWAEMNGQDLNDIKKVYADAYIDDKAIPISWINAFMNSCYKGDLDFKWVTQ